MKLIQQIKHGCFSGLAFVFFHRFRSLAFCFSFCLISFIAEIKLGWVNFFSCSGAVVSIAGLFLNIKYSLNFHLKIPMISLYNKLIGGAVFGTSNITIEQEKWVNGILSDEMFGVSFMVIGTLIWAYGSYLIQVFK